MSRINEQNEQELERKMREAIAFFQTAELPKTMKLSNCETITDTSKFISSHITRLRRYWKMPVLRQPLLDRFMKVYDLVKTKTYEQPDIELSESPAKTAPVREVRKPAPKKGRKK